MKTERHPTLDILVRSNGEVLVPQNGKNPAHWTFGYKKNDGYLHVQINGKSYLVHRLVAETFIPNPENKPCTDHISRDREDCRVENLRWCTYSENNRNTPQHDRVTARGEKHRYEYEDDRQFRKEWDARRRKTHKNVWFSDGKRRWVLNSEAIELLKIPVKERNYVR